MAEVAQLSLPDIDSEKKLSTGVLPSQAIWSAIDNQQIKSLDEIGENQVQPASLDLRLGATAYRVRASFLPGPNSTVEEKLESFSEEKIDLHEGASLKPGSVYIVPLLESLNLRKRESATANPKSSTGRLDVFARVITDFCTEFDQIAEAYRGPLWVEIAPRSFNIVARKGSRLVQLRIKRGSPPSSDKFLRKLQEEEGLVYDKNSPPGFANIKNAALAISVDAVGDQTSGLIGYKAKKTSAEIDLDKINFYDPGDFWEPVYRNDGLGIILDPGDFHILASKERITVPPDYASEMIAYDTLVGEFRVHYAGFFDPGFGYDGDRRVGTKAVLEVRSHDVPFLIEDGQVVGRLMYERLAATPKKVYGEAIGSSYQNQTLTLAKQFKR